jgi:hypothetical protein
MFTNTVELVCCDHFGGLPNFTLVHELSCEQVRGSVSHE